VDFTDLKDQWQATLTILKKAGPVLLDVSDLGHDTGVFNLSFETVHPRDDNAPNSKDKGKEKRKARQAGKRLLDSVNLGTTLGPFTLPVVEGGYYKFLSLGAKDDKSGAGIHQLGFALPVSAKDYCSNDATFNDKITVQGLIKPVCTTYRADVRIPTLLAKSGSTAMRPIANLALSFCRTPANAICTQGFKGYGIFKATEYEYPVYSIGELSAQLKRFDYLQYMDKTGNALETGGKQVSYSNVFFDNIALAALSNLGLLTGDFSFYTARKDASSVNMPAFLAEACTAVPSMRNIGSSSSGTYVIPVISDCETDNSITSARFQSVGYPLNRTDQTVDPQFAPYSSYPSGYYISATLGGFFGPLGMICSEYEFLNGELIAGAPPSQGGPNPVADPTTDPKQPDLRCQTGYNIWDLTTRFNNNWESFDPSTVNSTSFSTLSYTSKFYFDDANNGAFATPSLDNRVAAVNMAFVCRGVSVKPGPSTQLGGSPAASLLTIRGDDIYLMANTGRMDEALSTANFFNNWFLPYRYFPQEYSSHVGSSLSEKTHLTADTTDWTPLRGAHVSAATVAVRNSNLTDSIRFVFLKHTAREYGNAAEAFIRKMDQYGGGLGTIGSYLLGWFSKTKFVKKHARMQSAIRGFLQPKFDRTDFQQMPQHTQLCITEA